MSIEIAIYECAECAFVGTFEEWNEHSTAMKHPTFTNSAEQQELFAPTGMVTIQVKEPLSEGYLAEVRQKIAELVEQQFAVEDEKKAEAKRTGDLLKEIDAELKQLVAVLKNPVNVKSVECEWRDADDKPERVLYRNDTGEEIERAPLSAEERAEWEKHR